MVKDILERISKRIEKLEADTKNAEVLIRLGKEMGLDLESEEIELEKAKDELTRWKEAIERVKSEI